MAEKVYLKSFHLKKKYNCVVIDVMMDHSALYTKSNY